MRRFILAITCLGSAGLAVAEPVRLTDETIRRDLAGATLNIDTPVSTTIPVRMGADGFVSGEAGTLASMLGAAKDRGRWWTDHDRLCVKWFRWFDAKPRCITLQREGSRIYWRDQEGESGTATLEEVQRVAPVPGGMRPPVLSRLTSNRHPYQQQSPQTRCRPCGSHRLFSAKSLP